MSRRLLHWKSKCTNVVHLEVSEYRSHTWKFTNSHSYTFK
ncbi:hypothetical protein KUF71_024496 [Frankliniella fusca]|uniref:Uncharacterized protein n=1 Tax=Frankliniella fusca TaxID=407009 RepID=A0AAE1H5J1_9NEOP|nr:hypothetical protein KUF71_024496 [Frankliniella fusca]